MRYYSKKQTEKRKLNIIFRLFNDGIGYRYEFPQQESMDSLVIMSEETEFRMSGTHKAGGFLHPIRIMSV